MISYQYRFHRRSSLKFLFSNGRTEHSSCMAFRYMLNTKNDLPRIAVVVSKKISKRAVVRNKIRRRIYEIVRQNLECINMPIDIAIIVRSNKIIEISHNELSNAIVKHLNNIIKSVKI